MNIIFIGSQKIGYDSLQVITKKHSVVLIVTSKPDKHETWDDGINEFAKNKNIPLIYDKELTVELVKKLNPDIIIVAGFRRLINDDILEIPKFGTVGLHASLLPKFKGNAPLNYAILAGEKETGISLFQITKGEVDSGDILGQKKTAIKDNEYVSELKERVFDMGVELLGETLDKFPNIKYIKQEPDKRFYCKRTPDDGLINWHDSTDFILRLIRASEPDYPAFTFYNNMKIYITKAEKSYDVEYMGTTGQVGEILKNGDVIIITSDGHLKITEIRHAGVISKPSKILASRTIRL